MNNAYMPLQLANDLHYFCRYDKDDFNDMSLDELELQLQIAEAELKTAKLRLKVIEARRQTTGGQDFNGPQSPKITPKIAPKVAIMVSNNRTPKASHNNTPKVSHNGTPKVSHDGTPKVSYNGTPNEQPRLVE